jgi:DNA-directed RNA polymerase
MWLKVHLANLFGHNKISHQERAAWVDSYISEVRDSADNPLDGSKWWMQAEEPFQALATCIEIIAAIDFPEGHEQYLCRLPVHQDGSCNGLQHYAALGKDADGGQGN